MRTKLFSAILIIDLLTILVVVATILVPSDLVRLILGIPFLLFFPGYVLIAALFAENEGKANIERLALSLGLSIAIVALIGFGLNYTSWGIKLEPVVFFVAGFIFVASIAALIRQAMVYGKANLTFEYKLKIPGWQGSALNKSVTVILILAVIGAIGVLGFSAASAKVAENYTEFYILGINNRAQNYPVTFTLTGSTVSGVNYEGGISDTTSPFGKVTLGIVNHKQKVVTYSVVVKVDGQQVNVNYAGGSVSQITQIRLEPDEKWEKVIGFAPLQLGDNQKVEFLLFEDNADSAVNSLHLWINARAE